MSMPAYHITISEKIREYRKKNNLSQSEFGKLVGVSAQAVCKWEQQVCYPDIVSVPLLARILECRTDDFFLIRQCTQLEVEKDPAETV
ncbi:MAG: helix-turn-helix transcriptional regulator [Ruminococcaceae bacterium]|nr:helix-turn-helix transcriptional regulator [Oscillospiraceae bacterium]